MPLRSRNCRLQGPPSIISEIFKKITNRPCKFAKNAYLCIPENEGGRFFPPERLTAAKKSLKKICGIRKSDYLCNPKRERGSPGAS